MYQLKAIIPLDPSQRDSLTSDDRVEPAVPGRGIFPNSSPTPLCPLFLPPIWNLEPVCGAAGSELSPNFEKKPFFFGCFASSFSPTSSNPSSAVGGCLSNLLSLIADRWSRGSLAESRLCLPFSCCGITGDLAEISYIYLVSTRSHLS